MPPPYRTQQSKAFRHACILASGSQYVCNLRNICPPCCLTDVSREFRLLLTGIRPSPVFEPLFRGSGETSAATFSSKLRGNRPKVVSHTVLKFAKWMDSWPLSSRLFQLIRLRREVVLRNSVVNIWYEREAKRSPVWLAFLAPSFLPQSAVAG